MTRSRGAGRSENEFSRRENSCGRFPFSAERHVKHSPAVFTSRELNILKVGLVADKPPVPPKRRKRRMFKKYRSQHSTTYGRPFRKSNFTKIKGVAAKTGQSKAKEYNSSGADLSHSDGDEFKSSPRDLLAVPVGCDDDVIDKMTAKPLPFPMLSPELEYEIYELMMMQRVTESSKTRRRIPSDTKPPFLEKCNECVKSIPKVSPSELSKRSTKESYDEEVAVAEMDKIIRRLSTEMVDEESQNKVKQFFKSKFHKNVKYPCEPKVAVKPREDIIIDWENDYENLNEPVVLEGKSVMKNSPAFRQKQKAEVETRLRSDSITSNLFNFFKGSSDDEPHADRSNESFVASKRKKKKFFFYDSVRPKTSFENPDKFDGISLDSESSETITGCDRGSGKPRSDTEIYDKTSVSSISDEFNSYSDFDSDITETWCDENISLASLTWDLSEELSKSTCSRFDTDVRKEFNGKKSHGWVFGNVSSSYAVYEIESSEEDSVVVTLEEDKCRKGNRSPEKTPKFKRSDRFKSASETDLTRSFRKGFRLEEKRSRSTDFFRESSFESKYKWNLKRRKKSSSVTSDVRAWMSRIQGSDVAEDRIFFHDEEVQTVEGFTRVGSHFA